MKCDKNSQKTKFTTLLIYSKTARKDRLNTKRYTDVQQNVRTKM